MSKRTSIRIPDDLYQKLVARAEHERRTLSNLVVALLADATEKEHFAHKIAHTEGSTEDTTT